MDSPRPPRRRLTAAQKKAGIKLAKGWKKPEDPDPAAMYRYFHSPARIDGQAVRIGGEESRELHRKAIWRGMTAEDGQLRSDLSWQEKIVMVLRTATSPQDFNHEWWGAKSLEPDWVKKAEEIYRESWLYFTPTIDDLLPRRFGNKIGYFLTLTEATLELAATDSGYLAKLEQAELKKAQDGLEQEEREKVQVVLPGYDTWKQFVDESYNNALDLRSGIVALVADKAPLTEFGDFIDGFAAGRKKAAAIDLKDQLSDYNRTQQVVGILLENWESINALENRTEISRYIRNHLPDEKKKCLEGEKGTPWKSFCVWLRDIYDNIGLSPGTKGRPKKK